MYIHTSGTRAALSSGTGSNTSTTLAVILTGVQTVIMGMGGLDLSDASLEVGKQVTGPHVTDVETSNLGQSHTAMGANERSDSRNCGEG